MDVCHMFSFFMSFIFKIMHCCYIAIEISSERKLTSGTVDNTSYYCCCYGQNKIITVNDET